MSSSRKAPIPAFYEYISPSIQHALATRYSSPIKGVNGLSIVGGIPKKFQNLLSLGALQYMVDVYVDSLRFKHPLAKLLQHRKMKRHCINRAAKVVAKYNHIHPSQPKELRDVRIEDGTITLGYRYTYIHTYIHMCVCSSSSICLILQARYRMDSCR